MEELNGKSDKISRYHKDTVLVILQSYDEVTALLNAFLFQLTFMKGYTSGRDTNNNFNQHCQKHALITRHGKFRPI